MWQYVLCRASMMFAQVVTGTPAGAATPKQPAAAPPAGGAPAPANVTGVTPTPGVNFKHTIWHTLFLIIYFVVCVALVIAVLLQTTKSEGLSGIIGGSAKPVFKGKKGFEEILQEYTNYLAVGFLVLSLVLSTVMFRVY